MRTITYAEVKESLAAKYGGGVAREDDLSRELTIYKTGLSDHIMLLAGSPPKGYCIAANGQVSLYDLWGKRFKIFTSTTFVDDGGI